jgi:hypothetical protein
MGRRAKAETEVEKLERLRVQKNSWASENKDYYKNNPDKLAKVKEQRKAWRERNKEYIKSKRIEWKKNRTPEQRKIDNKKNRLRAKYDMSLPEFESLVQQYGGKCGTCGNSENLCVDHNHATGEVRGILCDSCNLAIGFAKEDVSILSRIISYLKKYQAP